MAKGKAGPRLNTQIAEEASSWFIDFSEGEVDEAGRKDFNRWLRISPEHVRAYLQVSAFWEEAEFLNKDRKRDMQALIDEARAAGNVFSLELPQRPEHWIDSEPLAQAAMAMQAQPVSRDLKAGRARRFAIAASVAVLCASAAIWFQQYRAGTYETQIGEQRSVTLADGSVVELNSHSRLRVRFTEQARTVELLEGQALFRVAKNPTRPFVVLSDETNVRAVGTQFDVYRKRTGTVVTVLEGRVAVSNTPARAISASATGEDRPDASSAGARRDEGSRQSGAGPVLLAAGEQVTVTATAVTAPQPANVAMATAWTQQKLVFESAPLREVVDEFNRYNRRRLVIEEGQLNEFHISGVFPSTDPGRLIEFLKQRFGVTVVQEDDRTYISSGASSGASSGDSSRTPP